MTKKVKRFDVLTVQKVNNSFDSLRHLTKLGQRQPAGTMPKREAQSLTIRALHIRKDGTQQGFESVLDGMKYTHNDNFCKDCKGKCKLNRLSIPAETLQRFAEEELSHSYLLKRIDYVKSEFSAKYRIEKRVLKMQIEKLLSEIKELKLLTMDKVLIESFTPVKIEKFRNYNQKVKIENSQILVKKQTKKTKRFLNNSQVLDIETSKSQKLVAQKAIEEKRIKIDKLKNRLESLKFYVPKVLTQKEQSLLLQTIAKEKSNSKAKKLMFRINKTKEFLGLV